MSLPIEVRPRIVFRIPESDPNHLDADALLDGDPEPDVFVIRPLSQLPSIIVGSLIIDGNTQREITGETNLFGPEIVLDGSLVAGDGIVINSSDNFIGGLNIHSFGHRGIVIRGDGNDVQSNYIGTDATGNLGFGNGDMGIFVIDAASNTIEGNVISGNQANGVVLSGLLATNNVVRYNTIGTNVTGTQAIGNRYGIHLVNAPNNLIEDNLVSGNLAGIVVGQANATGNTIRLNSIHSNTGLGIDLGGDGATPNDLADADAGPNGLQNFPVLVFAQGGTATRIAGLLNSTPDATFTLDFYANETLDDSGFGEGQRWIGSTTVSTDITGTASFDESFDASSLSTQWITATATDPSGSTSEFSLGVQLDQVDSQGRIQFTGHVTSVGDPLSGSFAVDDAMTITIDVDPAFPDTAPEDPTYGRYFTVPPDPADFGAISQLTATIGGYSVQSDDGSLDIYNDFTNMAGLTLDRFAAGATYLHGLGGLPVVGYEPQAIDVVLIDFTLTALGSDAMQLDLDYLAAFPDPANRRFNLLFHAPGQPQALISGLIDGIENVPGGPGGIEHAPVFTSQNTARTAENTTVVQTVSAVDADWPRQTITYSITGSGADDALFELIGDNQLAFIAAPDFERPRDTNTDNVYRVELLADDGTGQTTTQTVEVTVTDVNEAPTVYVSTFYVDENSPNSRSVGIVTASDPDAGDSYTFSITGGNSSGAFAINGATGEITVNDSTALDYETTPTFVLTVQVEDSGSLTGTASITINLNDIDPVDGPAEVIDAVNDLKKARVLSSGEANPILNHLNQAIRDYRRGKVCARDPKAGTSSR